MTEYKAKCPNCWALGDEYDDIEVANRRAKFHHEDTGHGSYVEEQ